MLPSPRADADALPATGSSIASAPWVYVLTWKNKELLVLDGSTLQLLFTRPFQTWGGEGWGLTYDPTQQLFVASDGTNRCVL